MINLPRYAKFHDQLLENFLNTNENHYFNRERTVFIKLKSNYI